MERSGADELGAPCPLRRRRLCKPSPVNSVIFSSLLGLLFGSVGAIATIRRGDLARHRVLHTIGVDERRLPRKFKDARRGGVSTVIYAIPPGLVGHVILATPHAIHNPGRIAIKNISVLITYSAKFGVTNRELNALTADMDDAPDEDSDYLNYRKGEKTGYGMQVAMSIPVLRAGETWHLNDFMAIPRRMALDARRDDGSPMADRFEKMSGFRQFVQMEITIYSEATRARTRQINLVVTDSEATADLSRLVNSVSDAVWGSARPAPGYYLKYPWQSSPMTWELGVLLTPQFVTLQPPQGPVTIEAPSRVEIAPFLYHAPAIDYRRMPNNLSPSEIMNYLGLSPVPSLGLAWRSRHFPEAARRAGAIVGRLRDRLLHLIHIGKEPGENHRDLDTRECRVLGYFLTARDVRS
jgi:hypothetical protein